jgi:hypothetical protein
MSHRKKHADRSTAVGPRRRAACSTFAAAPQCPREVCAPVVALACMAWALRIANSGVHPHFVCMPTNAKTAESIYFRTSRAAQDFVSFCATIDTFYAKTENAMSGRAMISRSLYGVAIRAGAGGRYTYQLFTMAGEPRTFLADDTSFDSPQEAERAGYEALKRLDPMTIVEAVSAEPSSE